LESNHGGNILQILSELPAFIQRPILQNKLREFLLMDDESKYETISMVMKSAFSVETRKLSELTSIWMDILCSLDGCEIVNILKMYLDEILRNQMTIENLSHEPLITGFMNLSDKNKEKFTDSLKEAIFLYPKAAEALLIIPKPFLIIIGVRYS
jgi:uncharacterized protein YfbU (UPF0304 family)